MVLLTILFYINYLFITTRRENILHISVHGETKALAWLIFLFFLDYCCIKTTVSIIIFTEFVTKFLTK